jgi:hypothetical protein
MCWQLCPHKLHYGGCASLSCTGVQASVGCASCVCLRKFIKHCSSQLWRCQAALPAPIPLPAGHLLTRVDQVDAHLLVLSSAWSSHACQHSAHLLCCPARGPARCMCCHGLHRRGAVVQWQHSCMFAWYMQRGSVSVACGPQLCCCWSAPWHACSTYRSMQLSLLAVRNGR